MSIPNPDKWKYITPESVRVEKLSLSSNWHSVVPEVIKVTGLSGTQIAGLALAAFVLVIITAVFIGFFALAVNSEINPSIVDFSALKSLIADSLVKLQNNCSNENAANVRELITRLVDIHKGNREFIMSIGQFALTSVLLPVLMALLGYIFGSNKS